MRPPRRAYPPTRRSPRNINRDLHGDRLLHHSRGRGHAPARLVPPLPHDACRQSTEEPSSRTLRSCTHTGSAAHAHPCSALGRSAETYHQAGLRWGTATSNRPSPACVWVILGGCWVVRGVVGG